MISSKIFIQTIKKTGWLFFAIPLIFVACVNKTRSTSCNQDTNPRKFVTLNINQMRSIDIDANNNIYLPDPVSGTLFKISENGTVSVLRIYPIEMPFAVAIDPQGRIIVADIKNWELYQLNGNENATPLIADKNPDLFHGVTTIDFDQQGNLYVGENDANVVRVITPDGDERIMAGNFKQKGNSDGLGTGALIDRPRSIAVDNEGNVFLADDALSIIRKITPNGNLITIAGMPGETGSCDGKGSEARFNHPRGIAVDKEGNVYISDTNNHTIRKITPDGTVTTIAGKAGEWGLVDGSCAEARFKGPRAITIDNSGNIIVADEENQALRLIDPNGKVYTFLAPDMN